jgi:hypothetical protein
MAYDWTGHRRERRDHIAGLLWRGFGHDRHGGPFIAKEGAAIVVDMTLEAADRALAAALKPAEPGLNDLGFLFDDMNALMHDGKWDFLNEKIEALDPFLMSDAEIVCYARTPFTVRDRLPAWAGFIERARTAMGMRASDVHSLEGL